MKNLIKCNLSAEFTDCFCGVFFDVLGYYGKLITIDHVVASIFNRYLTVKDRSNYEIKELSDYLNVLFVDNDKKLEFLNYIKEVVSDIDKHNVFPLDKELYSEDYMELSSDLCQVLNLARTVKDPTEEVTVILFLCCLSSFGNKVLDNRIFGKFIHYCGNSKSELFKILDKYHKLDPLSKKMIDGSFGLNLGDLKEKIIGSSDLDYFEDEDDDSEDEFDEENYIAKKDDSDEGDRRERDDREFEMAGQGGSNGPVSSDPNSTTPFLDQYSTNLSKQCRSGQFDQVIGREKEISQVIEILSCRKKSNVALLGIPGIGKTSVVIGLAQAINSGNVPRDLREKEIYTLDIMGMVSGSTFRGDAEKKILGCLNEMVNHPEVIIFIDEFHQIFGAGSNTPGSGDFSAIMKPYLSGTAGKITVIGATTDEEYRKFIEKDGALKRRFQEIQIEEPTIEETKNILEKTAPKFEEYHKVKYTPEALEACVNWSSLYINDRNHPDKDIDIIDIAGSLTKLKKNIDTSSIDNLEKAIKDVVKEKIELVEKQEFDEAQKRRDTEIALKEELKKEKSKLDNENNDSSNWSKVTVDDIASVISKMSKIPIDKIRSTSREKLREMKESMKKKVIGQDEAIEKLSVALNRQFLGLKDKNKPISFLLTGQTGTGKSYLTKILNESLFSNPKNLIKVDCSLFTQETSANSLIGAQSGYVGYGDKTVFHDVKKRPFSVILFDEIEKMNDNVINTIFLPILDEGKITLSDGSLVSFKDSVVIFTSNLGTKELSSKTNLGFSKVSGIESDKEDESIVMKAIKKKFRPELINRLSDIIFFKSLNKEDLYKIFDLELEKLKDRLSENGYTLEVSDKMKEYVVSQCDLTYGARDLQREIVKNIENPISNELVYSDSIGKNIVVDIDENNKSIVKFSETLELNIKKEEKVIS